MLSGHRVALAHARDIQPARTSAAAKPLVGFLPFAEMQPLMPNTHRLGLELQAIIAQVANMDAVYLRTSTSATTAHASALNELQATVANVQQQLTTANESLDAANEARRDADETNTTANATLRTEMVERLTESSAALDAAIAAREVVEAANAALRLQLRQNKELLRHHQRQINDTFNAYLTSVNSPEGEGSQNLTATAPAAGGSGGSAVAFAGDGSVAAPGEGAAAAAAGADAGEGAAAAAAAAAADAEDTFQGLDNLRDGV